MGICYIQSHNIIVGGDEDGGDVDIIGEYCCVSGYLFHNVGDIQMRRILCWLGWHKWSLWGYDPVGPVMVRHCEQCYYVDIVTKLRTQDNLNGD